MATRGALELKKLRTRGAVVSAARAMAGPLSHVAAAPGIRGLTRRIEAYSGALLGKGIGTGQQMRTEVRTARDAIEAANPVVFDVGANTGRWSRAFLELSPDSKLFLFEPQPGCHDALADLRRTGSILIPHAVSSTSGQTLSLQSTSDQCGIASLYPRRDSFCEDAEFSSYEVSTVTIDDVIREHGIDRVDFMKMDVEGHELAVLEGAAQSLGRGAIKAMSFEFGSGNINSRTFFHDFWDLLIPLGYSIHRILPSSRLLRIEEYCEDLEHFRGVTNYIATLNK